MKMVTAGLSSLVLALLLLGQVGAVLAGEGGWELSFDVVSDTFTVGEPIWAELSFENRSHDKAPAVKPWGYYYLDNQETPCRSVFGVGFDPPPPPPEASEGNSRAPAPPIMEAPGTVHRSWINLANQCRALSEGKTIVAQHTVCYRDDDSDNLLSNSVCDSFVITIPEGVDQEAFDAFGPNVVTDSHHWAELLRRFPTSTYAAYVVWQIHAKGWAGGKLDGILAFLNSGLKYERGLLPCSLDGKVADHETRLDGVAHVRCRDNWLQLVLKNHPDIWFAEEIQLRLATDAYLLKDKDACAVGLEALSAHAKPYVAEKAQALVEAMRAKNMLPGGPKDLAAAPAQAQPEGKTTQ